jgi:hypothetical protein
LFLLYDGLVGPLVALGSSKVIKWDRFWGIAASLQTGGLSVVGHNKLRAGHGNHKGKSQGGTLHETGSAILAGTSAARD